MAALKKLPWELVAGLGILALIRPLLELAGIAEGAAWSIAVTLLVSLVWVGVVVVRRVAQPLLTLVSAGAVYGILAVTFNLIAQASMPNAQLLPVVRGVLFFAMNVAWGALLGLVAMSLLAVMAPRGARGRGESVSG